MMAEALTIVAYGALVISDVTRRTPRLWLISGAIWIVALIVAALIGDPTTSVKPIGW